MKKILKIFIISILFCSLIVTICFANIDSNTVDTNKIDENSNENVINENYISNEIQNTLLNATDIHNQNVTNSTTNKVEDSKILNENNSSSYVAKIDGVWRMVINGKVDYNYTGIGTNENGTWVLENGKVTFNYTGTFIEGQNAYIAEESKVYATVTTSTTSVIKINGVWRMVIKGKVDYNYTGIGTNDLGTWLIENGKVTFKYTGIYKNSEGTYLLEASKLKTDTTTVMKIDGIWRIIIKGVVNYNYTGISTNENGTWVLENGKVTFNYTGTFIEGQNAYIAEESKVYATVTTSTTSVIKINGVWRMVIKGKVDYNYTGMGTNDLGIWLIENGKVTFKYTGNYTSSDGKIYVIENSKLRTDLTEVVKIDNVWRMVVKGIVDPNYTGIGTNHNGTWYVENGVVNFDYVGTYFEGDKAYLIEGGYVKAIAKSNGESLVKIDATWRAVVNGYIKYDYEGILTNDNGTWYVKNGVVDFSYTGTYKDSKGITYVIENNKVMTQYTKVMKIDGIWRMVQKGIVNYTYDGFGSNENGTWILEDGKVTFNYTGTYTEGTTAYIIEGSKVYATVTTSTTEVIKINNVWRMVINGYVDYNYNGVGSNSNGMWVVRNGVVDFNFTQNSYQYNGSTYNVKNGEVREVLISAGHPGMMCIDSPVNGTKRGVGVIKVYGWALSEESGDVVKIFVDGKYYATASRENRDDVFDVYKNQYGGKTLNPQPGYTYTLNVSRLGQGSHYIRVVNYSKDEKTIIQSREVLIYVTSIGKTSGIDVSHYNGNINWQAVRDSGVDFAILKIGEYRESTGTIIKDSNFDSYYSACKSLGIAVGGYFYSYAFNPTEASHEASACLAIINGKSFEMPIFLDVEDKILKNAVANGRTNKDELTNASITFCNIMNNNGHKSGVYASRNFFYEYLDTPRLEQYSIWLAHYTSQTDYTGKYDLWQYTSSGLIPGITGNVDLDWCFTRYY